MSDPSDPTDATLPDHADHRAVAIVETDATSMSPHAPPLDLDGIERDLADVEVALARLDSGEYWADEVTGASIPDEQLAIHPTARRLSDR